jgi:DNA-binding protein H-NS
MKDCDLRGKSVDELWELHEQINLILGDRLSEAKEKIERRLNLLSNATGKRRTRRPYPKVKPKYRNPKNQSETWSGRGKKPHWVRELVKAKRNLNEFAI